MTVERYLRMIAGAFITLSLALGYWVHPYWFLFTGFVGLNLLQSSFTNWCPLIPVLNWLGSENPLAWRWHDAQEPPLSCESRLS